MRRRLALAAVLGGVLATVLALNVAGAGTTPTADSCTDGPAALHAAAANPPGSSVETKGTNGDDTIFGTDATDVIDGGGGADCIDGGAGDDRLLDGQRMPIEEDHIVGGPGDDVIRLVNGNDGVLAGDGADSIEAANGRTDFVDCGPGNDFVRADLGDRLLDCEQAREIRNHVRRVSPRIGRPATRFLVRFSPGLVVDENNENFFSVALTPPAGSTCDDAGTRRWWDSTDARLGSTIRSLRLRGPGRRHRWCRGRWEGELIETFSSASSSCDSGDADPLSCTGDTRIGTFSFRVR